MSLRTRGLLRHSRYLATSAVRRHKATGVLDLEKSHFNALALTWWDVNGPQRILHKMNLIRMDFVHETIRQNLPINEGLVPEEQVYVPPYSLDLLPQPISAQIVAEQEARRDELLSGASLRALDVGCGGGILLESLARLSFIGSVKGIDLSEGVLEAARLHQRKDPTLTNLSYELTAVEDLPQNETYDIVTAFEMLEHVTYPAEVLTQLLDKVNVGGWVFLSTINRDFVSWFTTIFMGEHVLRIVPVGTHTLEKYIDHREIDTWLRQDPHRKSAYRVVDARGCYYLPAYGWGFTNDPNCGNYFMAIQRVA